MLTRSSRPARSRRLTSDLAIALFVLAGIIAHLQIARSSGRWKGMRKRAIRSGGIGIWCSERSASSFMSGAEVSIGSFLVNYFHEPEIGGLSLAAAAGLLTFLLDGGDDWPLHRLGSSSESESRNLPRPERVDGVPASRDVDVELRACRDVDTILAVGFFNSIMFPSIFTLAIDGLGPLTGKGSGLLVAAIVGGAIHPEVQGLLADRIGIHHAFFLAALCYLYIAFYGFKGSKHGHEAVAG